MPALKERLRTNSILRFLAAPAYRRGRLVVRRLRLATIAYRRRRRRIIIGVGRKHQRGWIPTDIETLNLLVPETWRSHFPEESLDAILAEHVWEHLREEEALEAATNSFVYLKAGGYLRVAVPDGFHPDPAYIEWVKPGGKAPRACEHKVLYNYKTFVNVFESVGFDVCLLEYFDEYGNFHYHDWDPNDGLIHRSCRFDKRNRKGKLEYTSIILDVRKPFR